MVRIISKNVDLKGQIIKIFNEDNIDTYDMGDENLKVDLFNSISILMSNYTSYKKEYENIVDVKTDPKGLNEEIHFSKTEKGKAELVEYFFKEDHNNITSLIFLDTPGENSSNDKLLYTLTHDSEMKLISVIDENNNMEEWSYDADDRIIDHHLRIGENVTITNFNYFEDGFPDFNEEVEIDLD